MSNKEAVKAEESKCKLSGVSSRDFGAVTQSFWLGIVTDSIHLSYEALKQLNNSL